MLKFIDTASADEYFLVEMIRRAARIYVQFVKTRTESPWLKEPGSIYIHVEIKQKACVDVLHEVTELKTIGNLYKLFF